MFYCEKMLQLHWHRQPSLWARPWASYINYYWIPLQGEETWKPKPGNSVGGHWALNQHIFQKEKCLCLQKQQSGAEEPLCSVPEGYFVHQDSWEHRDMGQLTCSCVWVRVDLTHVHLRDAARVPGSNLIHCLFLRFCFWSTCSRAALTHPHQDGFSSETMGDFMCSSFKQPG